MTVTKTPLVPDYIYAARVLDEDVPWFERQFFKNVDNYDPEVADTKERFNYARRIGYGYFARLKEELENNSAPYREVKDKIAELGNKGTHWQYIPSLLNEKSVVYGFGIGTDISFEVELGKKHGCRVSVFDPTPQATEYALQVARDEELIDFYPFGLFSRDTMLRFYKPTEAGLGSLSATNLHYSDVYIEAPVYRLLTVMRQLKDDHINFLKMDIEGAQYDAIDDLLFSGIKVDQIGVEFDQPSPPWRSERCIGKLYLAGFHLVFIDGLNALFVHERHLKSVGN